MLVSAPPSPDLGSELQPQSLEAGGGEGVFVAAGRMGVLTTEALSELKCRGLACLSATSVALGVLKVNRRY